MQYMLLIYESENVAKNRAPADNAKIYAEYMEFTQGIVQAGKFKPGNGNRLQPIGTATTVRVRDGKTITTDGPFAETKEQLGGYYLVEASDLDDAIRIAAGIPGAKSGSIELRPIMVMNH